MPIMVKPPFKHAYPNNVNNVDKIGQQISAKHKYALALKLLRK